MVKLNDNLWKVNAQLSGCTDTREIEFDETNGPLLVGIKEENDLSQWPL